MKFKCLVMDHDDTTVNSTTNVHYPSFLAYMKIYRPNLKISLDEYVKYNFDPGVMPFFTDICGLSEKECMEEQEFWRQFSSNHVSEAFPGIKEIFDGHKAKGGILAVVSHSMRDNIERDYAYNELPFPDMLFTWEEPKEERKPFPHSVFKIMDRFNLKPEEILVVDDLKPGYDMARAAGVKFAAAGWCFDIPENEKFMRENADYYFKTVKEFADFLKEE